MKKTVIALSGFEKTGKTSTIKKFYELLKLKYPEIKEIHSHIGGGDIQKILELNGVKIGIESQGDPDSRIFESLKMFSEKEKCDIIVCAIRTKGGTLNAVNKLVTLGYEIMRFSNLFSDEKDKDVMNTESAKILLHIFEKVLNREY